MWKVAGVDYLIEGGLVVTPKSQFKADVYVSEGVIKAVGEDLKERLGIGAAAEVISAEGKYLLPGGVDVHVHFGAVSRGFVSADDCQSGGIAAALGGTTTIVEMVPQQQGLPIWKSLEDWRERSVNSVVDYSCHVMVTGLTSELLKEIPLLVQNGYTSFKVFLGTDDKRIDDFEFLSLLEATRGSGAVILVSAGNAGIEKYFTLRLLETGKKDACYYAQSRPILGEIEGTSKAITLAEAAKVPIYFTHVSCREALRLVAAARQRGLPVFGETCPHYLLLSSEYYQCGGTEAAKYVVNPPLRERSQQGELWRGLQSGNLDVIASDHCSFRLAGQKAIGETFNDIPSGLPGIETRVPLLYSAGVGGGRLSLGRFVDLVAEMPARIFGLFPRKGAVAVGSDADLVIFDPEKEVELTWSSLHQKVDYCPYEGFRLKGYPELTMLRGRVIAKRGEFVGQPGLGSFIPRKPFEALAPGSGAFRLEA